METQLSKASVASASSHPYRVLLDRLGHRDDDVTTDATTVASSHTSTGRGILVSFWLAALPATSRLYLPWQSEPNKAALSFAYPRVIVAHGDSVLFQLTVPIPGPSLHVMDYFVYKASADPSRSLSLSRLPTCDLTRRLAVARPRGPRRRMVDRKAIGLLRCGEEFVVAELYAMDDTPVAVDLCAPLVGCQES